MSDTAVQQPIKVQTRSQARELWSRFSRHKGAVVGMVVFFAIVLVVAFGPLVYQVDASKTNVRERNRPPSIERPFGTDNLGRDLLAQNLVGGRISLSVGLAAMIISVLVGTVIGQLAGYYKRVDGLLMRITDMFLALPILPLLLVAVLLFRDSLRVAIGPQAGVFILIVVIIGGLGSIQGSLLGALMVGLTTNYVAFLFPKLALASTMILMMVVLLWRPWGLRPAVKG